MHAVYVRSTRKTLHQLGHALISNHLFARESYLNAMSTSTSIVTTVPIISKYTYRTNGTCQSPRIPGIGWSFFGADPEEGYKQAKQLTVSTYSSF